VKQEFFIRLSPEEKDVFAVCVGEILTKRGLVRTSKAFGGTFSVWCCLNVGWPNYLLLDLFERQSLSIAQEAIAAWTASKDPMKQWPYFSPTMSEKCGVFFCCSKPKTRDRWFAGDIELAELKEREGEEPEEHDGPDDHKYLESRIHFLEQQLSTANGALANMALTVKALSDKLESHEMHGKTE